MQRRRKKFSSSNLHIKNAPCNHDMWLHMIWLDVAFIVVPSMHFWLQFIMPWQQFSLSVFGILSSHTNPDFGIWRLCMHEDDFFDTGSWRGLSNLLRKWALMHDRANYIFLCLTLFTRWIFLWSREKNAFFFSCQATKKNKPQSDCTCT